MREEGFGFTRKKSKRRGWGNEELRLLILLVGSFLAIWVSKWVLPPMQHFLLLYLLPPLLTFGARQRLTILFVGTLSIAATVTESLLRLKGVGMENHLLTAQFSLALQSMICYLSLRQWRILTVEQSLREQTDAELREVSSDLAELERSQRRLERRNRELAALNEIASVISRSTDMAQAFAYALERIEQLTAHEIVVALCEDETAQQLGYFVHRGLTEAEVERMRQAPFREAFCEPFIWQKAAADVTDFSSEQHTCPLCGSFSLLSHVTLPITDGEKRLGVLILGSRKRRELGYEDLSFLNAVSNQLAAAITRDHLMREAQALLGRQLAFERRFTRLLTESAPVAIAHLTTDLRYVMANPIYLDLIRDCVGDPELELAGRSFTEVAPELFSDQLWQEDLARLVQQGQPFTRRAQMSVAQAKGGATYWDWTVWPVKDEEGTTESLLLMGIEMTERIRSQQQLEAALADAWTERNKLEAVIEHITDAVFIADGATKRVVRVNSAAARLLAFDDPRELEVELEKYPALIRSQLPDGTPLAADQLLLMRALRGEEVRNAHIVWRRRDGTPIHVVAGVSPIRNAAGEIILVVGIAHEVTSLLQIQAELERSNHAKDLFLAMLSHELRTPLTPILGWAHIMRDHVSETAVIRQGLEAIERNARLQAQLVDDLLDMSRIITGKVELECAAKDLNEIVRHALETVQCRIDTQMLDLELDLSPEPLPVYADAVRLEQVIWNLLSNAVKFTPARGRISVSTRRVGNCCQVEVADTGIGIKPELLPVIFNRFRQADSGTTRRHGGLGIGLAIARSLVEMHGGWIEAESKGEGRGARFTVAIPLRETDRQLPRPARKRRASSIRLDQVRVLVVEDSPDTRELLSIILQSYGAEVFLASSVPEGLKLAAEVNPEVVISDIGLPDIDGYEFVRQLRQLPSFERRPVIALTGYAMAGDRDRAFESGFDRHLPKPIEPEQLINAIHEVLSQIKA
jgi:PAS domain S-box-containing protein